MFTVNRHMYAKLTVSPVSPRSPFCPEGPVSPYKINTNYTSYILKYVAHTDGPVAPCGPG